MKWLLGLGAFAALVWLLGQKMISMPAKQLTSTSPAIPTANPQSVQNVVKPCPCPVIPKYSCPTPTAITGHSCPLPDVDLPPVVGSGGTLAVTVNQSAIDNAKQAVANGAAQAALPVIGGRASNAALWSVTASGTGSGVGLEFVWRSLDGTNLSFLADATGERIA